MYPTKITQNRNCGQHFAVEGEDMLLRGLMCSPPWSSCRRLRFCWRPPVPVECAPAFRCSASCWRSLVVVILVRRAATISITSLIGMPLISYFSACSGGSFRTPDVALAASARARLWTCAKSRTRIVVCVWFGEPTRGSSLRPTAPEVAKRHVPPGGRHRIRGTELVGKVGQGLRSLKSTQTTRLSWRRPTMLASHIATVRQRSTPCSAVEPMLGPTTVNDASLEVEGGGDGSREAPPP